MELYVEQKLCVASKGGTNEMRRSDLKNSWISQRRPRNRIPKLSHLLIRFRPTKCRNSKGATQHLHRSMLLPNFFTRPILPDGPSTSKSGIGLCVSVRPASLRRWSLSLLVDFTDPFNTHILKAYDEDYSKFIRGHKYKDNDKENDKDNAKTKTQTKCLKYPAYAIFLKSWWLREPFKNVLADFVH